MTNDDDDPPPDLQELVRKHGGYNRITREAWAAWDRANAEWQARRRLVYGPASARPSKKAEG
jgi:hypothetical protein